MNHFVDPVEHSPSSGSFDLAEEAMQGLASHLLGFIPLSRNRRNIRTD